MAMDWYNDGPSPNYLLKKLNYVDRITEGYNITPNFFISGIVQPNYRYTSNVLKPVMNGDSFEEFHVSQWENRLFDRDTLFALMYDINFLFVLYSYTSKSKTNKKRFKSDAKEKFKKNFTKYLNETYTFYSLSLKHTNNIDLIKAIKECFYDIKGKVFMPYIDSDMLIMALDEKNFPKDSDKAKKAVSQYFDYNVLPIEALSKSNG